MEGSRSYTFCLIYKFIKRYYFLSTQKEYSLKFRQKRNQYKLIKLRNRKVFQKPGLKIRELQTTQWGLRYQVLNKQWKQKGLSMKMLVY